MTTGITGAWTIGTYADKGKNRNFKKNFIMIKLALFQSVNVKASEKPCNLQ